MDTRGFMSSLEDPLEFLDLKNIKALIGVIELNRK
jgi:hypothetical protein